MAIIECKAPGCEGLLPEYRGRGRPRKWCSSKCQRRAESMASHLRRGTLEELAEEWRAFDRPDIADNLDEWRRMLSYSDTLPR